MGVGKQHMYLPKPRGGALKFGQNLEGEVLKFGQNVEGEASIFVQNPQGPFLVQLTENSMYLIST